MKKIYLPLLCCFLSISAFGQQTKYFRQLRYNHVSPFVDIVGIHSIDSITASTTSHYVFKYDAKGQLSLIINNHYHTEKIHPLFSIGAYKVVFTYEDQKEIRRFFDPNGKRVVNDRNVYKEVYLLTDKKQRKQLNFYDLDDHAMESNWEISEYKWEQSKGYIIEKRFDLNGSLAYLSPYFEFGITGIRLSTGGIPQGHYNLNEQLEPTENRSGVASYQDHYDTSGNHIKYTYHNEKDELIMNQWGYAIGEKEYDSLGNFIRLKLFDTKNTLLTTKDVYSNATTQLAAVASAQDSLQIKTLSLNYLMALQQLNPVLMDSILNDSLNKVTVGYSRLEQKEIARATTKEQMLAFSKNWNKSGTKFPFNPNNAAVILDIYDRIASVKLISDNWVEYLQLIKLDGKWEIMNLIWQHKDLKRYAK